MRLVMTVLFWMNSSPNRIFREVHRILRPIRMGNGAHIGFVGIAHVRINHLQVALVDGKIDGLADRAARMVH